MRWVWDSLLCVLGMWAWVAVGALCYFVFPSPQALLSHFLHQSAEDFWYGNANSPSPFLNIYYYFINIISTWSLFSFFQSSKQSRHGPFFPRPPTAWAVVRRRWLRWLSLELSRYWTLLPLQLVEEMGVGETEGCRKSISIPIECVEKARNRFVGKQPYVHPRPSLWGF